MHLHGLIWLVCVGLALRYGVPLLLARRQRQRLTASGIADIDRMDGQAFEQYLECLFRGLGYQVERTRYVGDYGADLVARKEGVKTVIQAKRYRKAVGIKAVQEAVAAKGMYGCTEAMVVTNSTYTKAAVELARANGVVLWDRSRLVEALLLVNKDRQAVPQMAEADAAPPVPSTQEAAVATCAACGAAVSEKVAEFCRTRPQRFSGRVLCYGHQKTDGHRAS